MAASSICSCSFLSCTASAPLTLRKPTSSSSLASSKTSSYFGVQALSRRINSSLGFVADGLDGRRRRRRDNRRFTVVASAENSGEWGARNPTTAEIESNFGDKVLGWEGTEHIKLIPPSLLGLSERSCTPLPAGTGPLSEDEATRLLRKVVGWRVTKTDKGLKIWTEWKIKDSEAGTTLFDRIKAVAEAEDQHPELHLNGENLARAELSTQSIGGLSINDFIFAAKVDKIKTSDLVRKNKFWA